MTENIFGKVKRGWDWVWNSDSLLSWVVAFIIIFVFVKFIFFPVLSLLFGTALPLAGVESSSMDHQIVKDERGFLSICGSYSGENNYLDFEGYWEHCGGWYEARNITQEQFYSFPLHNGFNKGDIVLVYGRFTPQQGDIIIFTPNTNSLAPLPIVHRIVSISDNEGVIVYQTKGDHNPEQLTVSNNVLRTDETKISPEQIVGKVIFRIPYLGWVKIWFSDLFNTVF